MSFSEFLQSRRADAKALVAELKKTYDYVSILGVDVRAKSVMANNQLTNISSGMDTECGFVVKMHDGRAFYEYSLDDISGDKTALAEKIISAVKAGAALEGRMISAAFINVTDIVFLLQFFSNKSRCGTFARTGKSLNNV